MRLKPPRRRVLVTLLLVAGLVALAVQMNRTQLWADREVYAGWRVQQHVLLGHCRLLDLEQTVRDFGWGEACSAALQAARRDAGLAPQGPHLVLLLHGMGRSPFLFRAMARDLRAAGFEAVAISYPSLTDDIAAHASQIEGILARAEGVERVSFVTHSLGGLVVRELLNREGAWREDLALGRVVMIAPPNQGSELAEALGDFPLYHWIGGPAAGEIAAGPPFAPLPDFLDVAVIAGGTAGGKGFNPLLSHNNDGIVTLGETALPGTRDWLMVPALHTVIAGHPAAIAATRRFLETGRLR